MTHLDTQVVVWLYGRQRDRIPPEVQRRIEAEPLAISPMVELELAYLHEIGRASEPPGPVLDQLGRTLGLVVSTAPFAAVVRHALDITWTRDPFDRLIAAQAVADDATLLTADQTILANFERATWGVLPP